jgi:hypothetical protein
MGRRRGAIKYEPIDADAWRLAHIDTQPDKHTLWRATFHERSDLTLEQKAALPDYESIIVSESEIWRIWPKEERTADSERKQLLAKAKKAGVDQVEIDKLQ